MEQLVIIQLITLYDTGSVSCHTETVTGHCLTINNISVSLGMSEEGQGCCQYESSS